MTAPARDPKTLIREAVLWACNTARSAEEHERRIEALAALDALLPDGHVAVRADWLDAWRRSLALKHPAWAWIVAEIDAVLAAAGRPE